MGRTLSRLSLALIVLLPVVIAGTPQPAAAAPPLRWPFSPGAEWRFLQGYNGSSHTCNGRTCYERYGIDLVREDGRTAGQPVYAMTSGEVAWVDPTYKCLSLDIGGGYFQITCHVDGVAKFNHGVPIKQGDQIGVAAGPGMDNGGTPHVHVGVYRAPSWQAGQGQRQPVPFSGQFAIEGSSFPADDNKSNQYVGTVVSSRMPLSAAALAANLSGDIAPARNNVAALTRADPEPPAGGTSLTVSLSRGWNLFSVPVVPKENSPSSVLAGIAGKYDVVSAYDPRNGWRSYRPGNPATSDLPAIEPSMGLWIKMAQPATFSLSGTPSTTTPVILNKGWNLIGYPSNRTQPVEKVFGPAIPHIERVITYRAADETWYSYLPAIDADASDLEIVAPGRAYWLYVAGNLTLRIPW